MKRFLTSTILIMIAAIAVMAQTSFRVKAPSRVVAGSKFAVTWTLRNAEGSSLSVPQINGCKLLYGPSTSTSQSYEVVNGKMSSSSQVDYTYYYLAETEGVYTIGEASIMADGKRLTTDPVKITVAASPQAAQGGSSQQAPVNIDDIDTQSSDRQVNADDVFVRIILSKPSVYEQEAVVCTIKLYTKYSISSFMPTRQPSFDGCLIQEIDLQPQLNEVETYKGQNYMTALLKQCIIYPQKSGKLTINSGNYDIKVVQYDTVNMGFFAVRNPQERSIKVSSNSAVIDVKPLPTPQPEGFTGAVGTFDVSSRLVGNNFRTNDPATLLYTITGTGNIKYVKEPDIDFPSEFELYTPKSDIDADVNPAGTNVTGSMNIEYTFVPQTVGDFHIGSDKFVYFDPSAGKYVTLTTPSYDIKVAKGLSNAVDVERQDIAAKNTDILHIVTSDKHPALDHTPILDRWWYWALYILVIAGLTTTLIVYRRNISRSADVAGRRLAKANKAARQRLKLAAKYMAANDYDKFIEETLRALWGYLGDKLSIPASQLTRQNISDELSAVGAPEDVTAKMIEALDDCEMARYTPSAERRSAQDLYAKATDAINAMESIKIRKKQ